jgi:hypothetical protein
VKGWTVTARTGHGHQVGLWHDSCTGARARPKCVLHEANLQEVQVLSVAQLNLNANGEGPCPRMLGGMESVVRKRPALFTHHRGLGLCPGH